MSVQEPLHSIRLPHIRHILPTLLYAAGLPIPEGADGKVLEGLFTAVFRQGHEEIRVAEKDGAAAGEVALTEEEDEALRRTLRDLGYL